MINELADHSGLIPAKKIPKLIHEGTISYYHSERDEIVIGEGKFTNVIAGLKDISCWRVFTSQTQTVKDEAIDMLVFSQKSENPLHKLFQMLPLQLQEQTLLIEVPPSVGSNNAQTYLFVCPAVEQEMHNQLKSFYERLGESHELSDQLSSLIKSLDRNQQLRGYVVKNQLISPTNQELLDNTRINVWNSINDLLKNGDIDPPESCAERNQIHELVHYVEYQIKWSGLVYKILSSAYRILLAYQYLLEKPVASSDEGGDDQFSLKERIFRLFALNNYIKATGESSATIHDLLGVLVIERSDESSFSHIDLLSRIAKILPYIGYIKQPDLLMFDRMIQLEFKAGQRFEPIEEHHLGLLLLLVADSQNFLNLGNSFNLLSTLGIEKDALVTQLLKKLDQLVTDETFAQRYLESIYESVQDFFHQLIVQYCAEFVALFEDYSILRTKLPNNLKRELELFLSILPKLDANSTHSN